MRIWENKEWKIAFQTQYSHFKYQIISFRLFIILANFQKYINKISTKKLDIFVIIYLDNILLYIKDLRQLYIEVIHWVLKNL